jgi:hypothetical protein
VIYSKGARGPPSTTPELLLWVCVYWLLYIRYCILTIVYCLLSVVYCLLSIEEHPEFSFGLALVSLVQRNGLRVVANSCAEVPLFSVGR